jgi:very-short-patch-repair endonuclease
VSEEAIAQATACGRLYPLYWSTYAVGRPSVGMYGRLSAAVLACGSGTVISHGTAAWLLGLWEAKPGEVEVIAPVEAGRKIPGIRRRFVLPPPAKHLVAPQGIDCTSPSRTIVDLAGLCSPRTLAAVVEQAAVLRVLDVSEVDAILAEMRRRGSRKLNLILENWRRYSPRTKLRSRMEAKMLPLLTHYSLPIPECNGRLQIGRERFEVDFLWRAQRVVVEADGGAYHDNPLAQARDSHRNQVLARADYKVPRVGWEELRNEPERAIAEIRRFLAPPQPTVP